jgi:hypothetical protein
MRSALTLSLCSTGVAWLVLSCAGKLEDPALPLGSGGATLASSGGATGSGGADGLLVHPPPVEYPANPLTAECELAAGSTDYTRSGAEWQCFPVEAFLESDPSTSPPTFPAGGMGGLGGAAGASCPAVSELDWSCRGGEGRCCPMPQCEVPQTPAPVDGQCCYVVYRSCGV